MKLDRNLVKSLGRAAESGLPEVLRLISHTLGAEVRLLDRVGLQSALGPVCVTPVVGSFDQVICVNKPELSPGEQVFLEMAAGVLGQVNGAEEREAMTLALALKDAADNAVKSLSFSEMMAVQAILEQLQGKEGVIVASKVAARLSITRSVLVNALRKLESAQILRCRSLGAKGTHIVIQNTRFVESLRRAS